MFGEIFIVLLRSLKTSPEVFQAEKGVIYHCVTEILKQERGHRPTINSAHNKNAWYYQNLATAIYEGIKGN